jgi:hypothetical protein
VVCSCSVLACVALLLIPAAGCRRAAAPDSRQDGRSTVAAVAPTPPVTPLYSDEEAKVIGRRAPSIIPAWETRTKRAVFESLRIDPTRLRDRRVVQFNQLHFETWQLSEGFDIVWAASTRDPTPLENENRQIAGVRVERRPPVNQDLEALGLLSNQPLQQTNATRDR